MRRILCICVQTFPLFLGMCYIDQAYANTAPDTLSFLADDSRTAQRDYAQWRSLIEDPSPKLEVLKQFIMDHPDWPSINELKKKFEKMMTLQMPEKDILDWFSNFPPETIYGVTLYCKTLLRKGLTDRAMQLIKKTWWEKSDFPELEQFQKDFQDVLTTQDHMIRVDNLLCEEKIDAAKKTLSWLNEQLQWFPKPQRDLAQLRIDLLNNDPKKKAELEQRLIDGKAIFKDDVGLIYEEIKWRRKNKENDAVIKIIQDPAFEGIERGRPVLFWGERNILVRRMIEEKKYQHAIDILNKHQLSEGEHFVNAEWLAAFLLVTFLKKPDEAHDRLKKLIDKVAMPISYSRIYYWLGICAQKMKSKEQAADWFKKAAVHVGTYYGQLAINALEDMKQNPPDVVIFQEQQPNLAIKETFEKRDMVKALRFMVLNKEPTAYVERFFKTLGKLITDVEEYRLLVDFSSQMAPASITIELCRQAKEKMIMTKGTYPILDDAFLKATVDKLITNNPLFPHLVHALIRRESAFDPNAVSVAGAKGLMQVMQATAKQTIDKLGFLCGENCRSNLQEPVNNVAIGTMYIKEQLETYKGSLPLAICAYNAGPQAVDNLFCTVIGDPRSNQINMIEWIELIPFYETRNYVQRVLENLAMYMTRARLSNPNIPIIRMIDLLTKRF
ncbi:MAG: Membrane-bound lytic murein transglycosylase C [Holosporales bacterium]